MRRRIRRLREGGPVASGRVVTGRVAVGQPGRAERRPERGPGAGTAGSDRPRDPRAAEARVRENWERFFDPAVPGDRKTGLLENGSALKPVIEALDARTRAAGTARTSPA
ncbi:hypothetical protein NKH77_12520 [Streptomyces sp. M19]